MFEQRLVKCLKDSIVYYLVGKGTEKGCESIGPDLQRFRGNDNRLTKMLNHVLRPKNVLRKERNQ